MLPYKARQIIEKLTSVGSELAKLCPPCTHPDDKMPTNCLYCWWVDTLVDAELWLKRDGA